MILRILWLFWKPIAALLGIGATYLKGRADARAKAKIEDYEHAQDIADSVTRNRADGLRKYEDAGFRD